MAITGTVLILGVLSVLDRVEGYARRRLDLPPDQYDVADAGPPNEGKSEDLS
jgi:hypothetical protein